MQSGHTFSVEEHVCDCYEQPGLLNEECPHPTRKREAFLDELTETQLKFIFHAEQERERMKREKVDSSQNQSQMKQQF